MRLNIELNLCNKGACKKLSEILFSFLFFTLFLIFGKNVLPIHLVQRNCRQHFSRCCFGSIHLICFSFFSPLSNRKTSSVFCSNSDSTFVWSFFFFLFFLLSFCRYPIEKFQVCSVAMFTTLFLYAYQSSSYSST